MEDKLQIFNQNGKFYADSREVAEMVNKEHSKLMRDIRIYCEYLGQSKIGQPDFFVESTYTNLQNKQMPCYLINKYGKDYNSPSQKSMELKLMEIKETTINHSSGKITTSKTPLITGKGQQYFIKKFLKEKSA